MLVFSLLKRRMKRVFICLKRALPDALSVNSGFLFILLLFSYFFLDENSVSYSDALNAFFILFIPLWMIFFFAQLKKYGMKIFHCYDEKIINDAFTDLSKKSALFEAGLETLHNGCIRQSLAIFTDLDDESFRKTTNEQGVLSFYRGYCYTVLELYTNALIQYEKAANYGFSIPTLPFFMAQCHARNGNVKEALELFNDLLDSDIEYADMIRTEIGNMYLGIGDGENAYKWFSEAIEKHQNYAEALGGASIAMLLQQDFTKSRQYYNAAILNNIRDPEGFKKFYSEVKEATMLNYDGKGHESEETYNNID